MRTDVRKGYEVPVDPAKTVTAVLALAGGLRTAGVPVSTGETIDAVNALAAIDVSRRDQTRAGLRATLLKTGGHLDTFNRLFDLLFPPVRAGRPGAAAASPGTADPTTQPGPTGADPTTQAGPTGADPTAQPGPAGADLTRELIEALRRGDEGAVTAVLDEAVRRWAGIDGPISGERHHLQRVLRRLDLGRVLKELMRGADDRTPLQRQLDIAEAHDRLEEIRSLLEEAVRAHLHGRTAAGPDPEESGSPPARAATRQLEDVPVLRATPDELAALRAALRPLARRIASRLGQRRRRGRGHLDMRRTIRQSMSAGGVPLTPQLRHRRPTRPDLVVLCDVSGSTAQFAPFTLTLLHALHEEFRRVRSWVFIDGVVEVTGHLRAAPGVIDVHHLLARRGLVTGDGRSDYRAALARFLDRWPEAVTGKTTVLVIGDARHHDREPAFGEMAELKRLGRRLYWFNPEPRGEWDTADSLMSGYAARSSQVYEVSTLRQLAEAVAAIG